mmetsp:Transcript_22552/g.55967  ORF Transcript_22552/g.55967 Transcript_22552/m.55967 type:complete len:267 (+) Transcript_22552:330-1130(+)
MLTHAPINILDNTHARQRASVRWMNRVQKPLIRPRLPAGGAPVELAVVVRIGERLGVIYMLCHTVICVFVETAVKRHHFGRITQHPIGEQIGRFQVAVFCFAGHNVIQAAPWHQPPPQVVSFRIRHPGNGVLVSHLDQRIMINKPVISVLSSFHNFRRRFHYVVHEFCDTNMALRTHVLCQSLFRAHFVPDAKLLFEFNLRIVRVRRQSVIANEMRTISGYCSLRHVVCLLQCRESNPLGARRDLGKSTPRLSLEAPDIEDMRRRL